jgi:hypothetical protein
MVYIHSSESYLNVLQQLDGLRFIISLQRASLLQIVTAEEASNDGLQEKLTMSVAVPLLWGCASSFRDPPCRGAERWRHC